MIFAWLLAVAAASASDSGAAVFTLNVSMRSETELSATEVELLRRETERLFSPAGLSLQWLADDGNSPVRVVLARRPVEPVVYGCSRGLHDHRLALARPSSREITLWTEQVARAATGIWDARKKPRPSEPELGRALGRTLAHELGHVLLGGRRHERRGLMRARFKHHELVAERGSGLAFSKEELRALRTAVAELQQGRTGISPQR